MSWRSPRAINLTVAASDTAHARWIGSLNSPELSQVVIRGRADTRRIGWVAADLLAALGKQRDVTGVGRNDDTDWLLAHIWLVASDIDDLVITDLANLPADVLHRLLLLTCSIGVTLWLVADHAVDQAHFDVLKDWPVTPVPREKFDEYWRRHDPARGRHRPSPGPNWPVNVPDVDFPVFRAEARRQLSDADFNIVDAAYLIAYGEAQRWVTSETNPTEELVAGFLRHQLSRTTTTAQMTTIVRATQAALFVQDWLVQVDLIRLLASNDAALHAVATDPGTWQRLLAYPEPHRGVICAFTAAGLDAATQVGVCLEDLNDAGDLVTVEGRTVALPRGTRLFVHAQRYLRQLQGAEPQDPLLATATGSPLSPKSLATVLTAAARDLGVPLVSGQVLRSDKDDRSWLRRRGVSVIHLVADDAKRAKAQTARAARITAHP